MNKKNTEYLFKNYPELYDKKGLMGYGFACNDGWFNLINELSKKLIKEVKESNLKSFSVEQVKEKWGGLRYYASGGNNKAYKIIDDAEDESYKICEMCGKPGKLRDDLGWVQTLCDKHYKKKLVKLRSEMKKYGRKDDD